MLIKKILFPWFDGSWFDGSWFDGLALVCLTFHSLGFSFAGPFHRSRQFPGLRISLPFETFSTELRQSVFVLQRGFTLRSQLLEDCSSAITSAASEASQCSYQFYSWHPLVLLDPFTGVCRHETFGFRPEYCCWRGTDVCNERKVMGPNLKNEMKLSALGGNEVVIQWFLHVMTPFKYDVECAQLWAIGLLVCSVYFSQEKITFRSSQYKYVNSSPSLKVLAQLRGGGCFLLSSSLNNWGL